MSQPIHPPGLWSTPGDGVLARQGGLVLLSSVAESGLVDRLLDVLAETADGSGDGGQFTSAVEDVLENDDSWSAVPGHPPAPAVVAFGPFRGGMAVTVGGAAWAELTTSDGTQSLAAGQSPMLLRCVLGYPVIAVHGGLSADRPERGRTDRFSRLDGGTMRAGRLSYYTGQSAAPEPPRPAAPGPPPAAPGPPLPTQLAEPPAQAIDRPEPRAFDAVLLVGQALDDLGKRPPLPLPGPQRDTSEDLAPGPSIMGVYCKNGHFDDPDARFCAVCGISMNQQTLVPRLGPRPPLGVLVLDDGAILQLDADYVIGREPGLDASVAAGEARPLPVVDETGTVSRVHAQIRLADWRVLVTDLGSANGTRIGLPDGTALEPLTPQVPALLGPGSRIDLGGCVLRYESHRGR
jgi:hypothetical protein